jgi:tetratricopeptide (TPR) repeat protein
LAEEKERGIAGVVGFLIAVMAGVAAVSLLSKPKAPVGGTADATVKEDELVRLAAESTKPGVPLSETARALGAAFDADAPVSSGTIGAAIARASDETGQDPKGAAALCQKLWENIPATPELRKARTIAFGVCFKRDEKDLAARVAYSEALLDDGDYPRIKEILEPHKAELGSGDGARTLGVACFESDAPDEAFELLHAYHEAHVAAFARALEGLKAADDAATTRAKEALAHETSDAFKRAIGEATPEHRRELMNGWVLDRAKKDPTVKRAIRALVATLKVATTAVHLGALELQRAATRPPVERKQHLEASEHYYVSVLPVVATDENLLALARVRFDLGREKEARGVLDELYSRHGRSGEFLLALAVAFNGLGPARATEKELSEEAFGKLPEGYMKEKAAALRAIASDDLGERVSWLEKAGSTPPVPGIRARAMAELANDEGRFEDATGLLDDAIAAETSGSEVPVHVARLRAERFQVTGDLTDLDRCIDILEHAASAPDAGVDILCDLADALTMRAVSTIVKDRVQVFVLRDSGYELLHFAAVDEKDLMSLAGALAANADRARALELRERAIKKDPTYLPAYAGIFSDASARRDVDGVLAILDRISKAPLEHRAGGNADAALRAALDRSRRRADALLKLARAGGDPATIARALCARGVVERDAGALGAKADEELDVNVCSEAAKIAPRLYTNLALESALVARAFERLRGTSSVLDSLAKEQGKLGTVSLLALAVKKDEKLAAAVAADEDVKRAAGLVPADGEPQSYHLRVLQLARSDAAAALEKRLGESKLALARSRTSVALDPSNPDAVLELVTVLRARGEADEASRVLGAAAKDGVTLPGL